MTGELFDVNVNQPKLESQVARLQSMPGDAEDLVRQRYNNWNENVTMLEEAFKDQLLTVDSSAIIEAVAN